MSDNNGESRNIDELLRMRSELDRELHSKYQREVTVLFTDIKGSTTFFETRGDLEGRAMVQTHNDMLFPIVERHGGTIIKTIGDAIMATFQVPLDAVEAAVDMQRALDAHNRKASKGNEILVRIGINHGKGLVEKTDVYGDVVNLAARIESLADGGEILVTDSVYRGARNSDDVVMRYHTSTEVKGKAEPQEVYRVVWNEDLDEGMRTATVGAVQKVRSGGKAETVLTLEFSREGGGVKVSASEKSSGQERTLKHYEEKPLAGDAVEKLCAESISLLNRANRRGKVSKEILVQLREVGQKLYDALLTPKAKELVAATKASSLIISIDDRLVHIPWEMLYDGEDFLCLRFSMGRVVNTRQSIGQVKQRSLGRPLRMLVISDPKEDLSEAYTEGVSIRDEMDRLQSEIIANLRSGPVDAEYAKSKMRNYDILHYAGHADYDLTSPSESGWLMDGGKLTARDILEMAGSKPMPALVFSNACHSGQTDEWSLDEKYADEIFGLANAFLLSGVQHYIGTFWEILDQPSAAFAVKFYSELMAGAEAGEALKLARQHLIKIYGEDNIVWASYMLYGDPTFVYRREYIPASAAQSAHAAKPAPVPVPEPEYAVAGGSARAAHAAAQPAPAYQSAPSTPAAPSSQGWMKYAAVAAAAAGIAIGGLYFSGHNSTTTAPSAPVETAAETAQHPVQTSSPSGGTTQPSSSMQASNTAPPAPSAPVAAATPMDRLKAREAKSRESAEKRQRVQEIAKQLVAQYKERAASGAAMPSGAATGPVTLSFVGFSEKGDGSGSEGEDEYLMMVLQDKMVESGKIKVVERDLLDGVLAELNLSSSDLADQKTALKVGNILSARYIATGNLMRIKGEYRVSMRVIETETTALKTTVSASGKGDIDFDSVAGTIADGLNTKLAGKI